jgi:hypothetical protein
MIVWRAPCTLGRGLGRGCGTRLPHFAQQRPNIAFHHPIAPHEKLDRDVAKQLVEGWLGATRLAHDILPSETQPPMNPGLLPNQAVGANSTARRLASEKKSEFV